MDILYSGGTHCSQNSKVIHFGLGKAEASDSIVIYWPSGITQALTDLPINEKILVNEGSNDFDILGCMDSSSKNYNENATLNSGCLVVSSVVNLDIENERIEIFPNPLQEFIRIKLDDDLANNEVLECEIYDMEGKKVYSTLFFQTYRNMSITIPSQISSGSYILKLVNKKWRNAFSKRVQILSK